MNAIRRFLAAMGKTTRLLLAVVAATAMLWAIVYRFILGFTPLWLDVATIGATALALLVLWALSKGGSKFDYSARVNEHPSVPTHKP